MLKGKLNLLQEEALQLVMIEDMQQERDTERERMKYTILAGNLHLWKELYEDEGEDEGVEWFTPKSAEDIEQIDQILEGITSEDASVLSE